MFYRLKSIGSNGLILFLALTNSLRSEDISETGQSYFAMPTMGGKQFWADEMFFHKWRVQRNVFTGHYRLLDGQDRRHASGTFNECREVLEDIKLRRRLPPINGKAVVVLHGLFRSRSSMDSLCDYLEEHGGYEVLNVTYPSTQYDIGQHAQSLDRIIDNLDGIEEVNFVAHSMGNIVIRHYLGDLRKQEAQVTESSATADVLRRKRPKFNRFVMLAPPNHEAQMATFFADNVLFKTITGESGQQLGRQWKELEGKLSTPDFDFAVVAGGKNNGKGYNPLLPGDNDGTISVDTTKLPGARDFIVLPVMHTVIMNDARVREITLQFLQRGYFLSEAERNPLDK